MLQRSARTLQSLLSIREDSLYIGEELLMVGGAEEWYTIWSNMILYWGKCNNHLNYILNYRQKI